MRNNFSPNILAELDDICKKKIFFGGNFYFFYEKKLIFLTFFNFLRPAFGHGRLGHPQSLEYFRFEKLSIGSIYDYIWVKIAYGLEIIVLMPRTWSVRFFAQKTPCLVA